MKENAGEPIPKDVALQLCEEIRKKKAGRPFTQCWGCVKFSKSDPTKMCLSGPGYRGCKLVNERYDQAR